MKPSTAERQEAILPCHIVSDDECCSMVAAAGNRSLAGRVFSSRQFVLQGGTDSDSPPGHSQHGFPLSASTLQRPVRSLPSSSHRTPEMQLPPELLRFASCRDRRDRFRCDTAEGRMSSLTDDASSHKSDAPIAPCREFQDCTNYHSSSFDHGIMYASDKIHKRRSPNRVRRRSSAFSTVLSLSRRIVPTCIILFSILAVYSTSVMCQAASSANVETPSPTTSESPQGTTLKPSRRKTTSNSTTATQPSGPRHKPSKLSGNPTSAPSEQKLSNSTTTNHTVPSGNSPTTSSRKPSSNSTNTTDATPTEQTSPKPSQRPSLTSTMAPRAAPTKSTPTTPFKPSRNSLLTARVQVPTVQKPSSNATSTGPNSTGPQSSNTSVHPTAAPTTSFRPQIRTQPPTTSPTPFPTATPTTPPPTPFPTRNPTEKPTETPTRIPTVAPTFSETSVDKKNFRQTFRGPSSLVVMNSTQVERFQFILESYTDLYGGTGSDRVSVDTVVTNQVVILYSSTHTRRMAQEELIHPNSGIDHMFDQVRRIQVSAVAANELSVDYSMAWESNQTNVTGSGNITEPYDELFLTWMQDPENSAQFVSDLQLGGLDVNESLTIFPITPSPPTLAPTSFPTGEPTIMPTAAPTATPTAAHALSPATRTIVTVAGAGVGGLLILAGLGWFFFFRGARGKKGATSKEDYPNGRDIQGVSQGNGQPETLRQRSLSHDSSFGGMHGSMDRDIIVIDQQESLNTHPSMVSANVSLDSDSEFESDSTQMIADEFDEYKNQKLEKMREEVEGNVDNMDGMMSQALTRVLMDDEDELDMRSLLWGGTGDSTEIEASVLCETNDWLKRKEDASLEERNAFMQDLLNRMVATVRHNIIAPEKGSRAIHGAAAMLGLQLAGDLPETAILVSGMRHKAQKKDVIDAFKEYGEIEGAAVAPNSKGFGLVRFVSPKAVQRAMERYRTDKIDVQDVSVNIRVLCAPSAVAPPPVEVTRQLSSGQLDPSRRVPSERKPGNLPERRDRGRGVMESNNLPQLETIGYPSDSLGRTSDSGRKSRLSASSRGPGSDAGSSDHSRNVP